MKSKIVSAFIAFSSVFAIAMLIVVLYNSIIYWKESFSIASSFNKEMFNIGLLIAIVYACTNWIISFIKEFARAFRHIFMKGGN